MYFDRYADAAESGHVDIILEEAIHDEAEIDNLENLEFNCILTKSNVDNSTHGVV